MPPASRVASPFTAPDTAVTVSGSPSGSESLERTSNTAVTSSRMASSSRVAIGARLTGNVVVVVVGAIVVVGAASATSSTTIGMVARVMVFSSVTATITS